LRIAERIALVTLTRVRCAARRLRKFVRTVPRGESGGRDVGSGACHESGEVFEPKAASQMLLDALDSWEEMPDTAGSRWAVKFLRWLAEYETPD
jgi:hypothetical protein